MSSVPGADNEAALQDAVTRIVQGCSSEKKSAISELLPQVYRQLRILAQQRIAEEAPGHTLQATALVHEAFVRLVRNPAQDFKCRAYFYTAAAEAMRLVLIDHARSKGRLKRGSGHQRVPLGVADLASNVDPQQVLAMDDAIQSFEREHPDAADVVRLRFYAGLSVGQTAEVLEMSVRTVEREWAFARAWLFRALEDGCEH